MPTREIIKPLASQTLKAVVIYALLIGCYALLPIWKEHSRLHKIGDLPANFHAALTLVLGWLLVFRTNQSYARWWEARTLWGALVNACRNLAAKSHRLANLPEESQRQVVRDLVAFPYALRDHLREGAKLEEMPGYEHTSLQPKHVPGFLVSSLYKLFGEARAEHVIDGDDLRVIDADLRRLLDICGGCERIRNTRIVASYRFFSRQCIFLYLITLPWAIVAEFRVWTVPLTIITAYFMIGLETVAEHVEEPFGYDEDDLDLDGLCETIKTTVLEIAQTP